MIAINDTIRRFASRGLLPLSFVAAIVTGDPHVQAYEAPPETVIEQHPIHDADDNTQGETSFGAQLFTPATFQNTTGMWVGRNLSTVAYGNGDIPQLHEYFASDDNKLYRTTITSAGKHSMVVDHTDVLPEKVMQSLRNDLASMSPKMVFDHFV